MHMKLIKCYYRNPGITTINPEISVPKNVPASRDWMLQLPGYQYLLIFLIHSLPHMLELVGTGR
jgi:hypothetical protein